MSKYIPVILPCMIPSIRRMEKIQKPKRRSRRIIPEGDFGSMLAFVEDERGRILGYDEMEPRHVFANRGNNKLVTGCGIVFNPAEDVEPITAMSIDCVRSDKMENYINCNGCRKKFGLDKQEQ